MRQAQNNSIQNGVNIQEGDFTFIYPSVCLSFALTEDYIRINDTFVFVDLLSISSEIELGLSLSQIQIFLLYFITLWFFCANLFF
jgi:hypothetical protein